MVSEGLLILWHLLWPSSCCDPAQVLRAYETSYFKEAAFIDALSSLPHAHSDSASGVPSSTESAAKVPRMLKDAVLSPPSRNDSGRVGRIGAPHWKATWEKLLVGYSFARRTGTVPALVHITSPSLPKSSLLIMCTYVHVHRPEGLSAACWQWDIFKTPLYNRPINLHFSCGKVLWNLLFSYVVLPYVCMYVHAYCCTTGACFHIICVSSSLWIG